MSDTPRTDEQEHDEACNFDVPWSEFARTLERELAEAKAKLVESEVGAARLRAILKRIQDDYNYTDSSRLTHDTCVAIDKSLATDAGKSALEAVRGVAALIERLAKDIDDVNENGRWTGDLVDIETALSRLLETFGTGGSEG